MLLEVMSHFRIPQVGTLPFCTTDSLLRCIDGKGQYNFGQAVLIPGVGILDVRLRFLQLRLGKLDD